MNPHHHLRELFYAVERAQLKMTTSQEQFDADLTAFVGAVGTYETAVTSYVSSVKAAAPDLSSEDAEVQTAEANLTAAQTALAAVNKPSAPPAGAPPA